MASELALKIAQVLDDALASSEPSHVWRGLLSNDEEWKVMVHHNNGRLISIIIKNRTPGIEEV
jgi:hypothetical protein